MLGNTGHEKYQYMKLYMIMAFSSIYIIPLGTFSGFGFEIKFYPI